MRAYEGWSLRDRSFVTAVGISLLWHFFWFFSISITVSPLKRNEKARPVIVSLGPVIDDSFFRTLVQTKPQLSETFYRHLSDFSKPMDLQVKTIERRSPGDVVSLPFRKKVSNLMRSLIGGQKAAPEYEFASRIKIGYSDEVSGVEGEAKNRQVLSRPPEPVFPADADPAFRDSEVGLQFVVEPSGSVSKVEVALSSGSPDIDLVWVKYLRRWQFSPLGMGKSSVNQNGKVKLRFGGGE